MDELNRFVAETWKKYPKKQIKGKEGLSKETMQKFIKETLETEVKGNYEQLRTFEVEKAYEIFKKDKNDIFDK